MKLGKIEIIDKPMRSPGAAYVHVNHPGDRKVNQKIK